MTGIPGNACVSISPRNEHDVMNGIDNLLDWKIFMNITEMNEAFRKFENKYGIPPVYPMADGDKLGAFIITFKSHDSFMITAESPDVDINDAASMLDPDNMEEAAKDIRALQKMCSPIDTNAVPPTLH